jgi:cytosine/adenosine deaminase-related metal-dependent hydrolase
MVPGLVNAHTHLEYGRLAGRVPPAPFVQWLPRMIDEKRAMIEGDGGETVRALAAGLDRLARTGVSAVGDVSSMDLSVPWLEQSGLRYVCFLEVIHPGADRLDELVACVEERLDQPTGPRGRLGLSPHAPYSVSRAAMETLRERFHRRGDRPFCVHAAEFPEEIELLERRRGALVDFMRARGFLGALKGPSLEGLARGVVEFLDLGRPFGHERDLLIHGNCLSDEDLDFLAREDRSILVACPGTRLHHGAKGDGPARAWSRGLPVALGTDSLASNDVLNMWTEMRRALALEPGWRPRDALRAATLEGARALGLAGQAGALRPGWRADFAVAALPEGLPEASWGNPDELLRAWLARDGGPAIRELRVGGESILERPLYRKQASA